jgi:hypothetical protein
VVIRSGLAGNRIEVADEAPDRLTRTVWQFDVSMGFASRHWNLVLCFYRIEARPTWRHKWSQAKGTVAYDRYAHSIDRRANLKPEDVPLPPEVRAAALHEFIERVEVTV